MAAMSMDSTHSEVAVLSRLIHRAASSLAPEAARALLAMEFPEDDQKRMRTLADKAAAGTLTPEERTELECYNRVGYMLSVLHANARRALERADKSS
jgi:uncharacterized protein (DUF2236 family)